MPDTSVPFASIFAIQKLHSNETAFALAIEKYNISDSIETGSWIVAPVIESMAVVFSNEVFTKLFTTATPLSPRKEDEPELYYLRGTEKALNLRTKIAESPSISNQFGFTIRRGKKYYHLANDLYLSVKLGLAFVVDAFVPQDHPDKSKRGMPLIRQSFKSSLPNGRVWCEERDKHIFFDANAVQNQRLTFMCDTNVLIPEEIGITYHKLLSENPSVVEADAWKIALNNYLASSK